MATSQEKGKPLYVGDMKIRDLGNSVGVTLGRRALEDLGVVDEDGELTGDYYARQVIREDGSIEVSLNIKNNQ